jgi:chromosomal replication initiator protein
VPLFEEAASPAVQEVLESAGVNQKYSFSNFVVGQTNQLAYAAALAVAEAPYERYNPLLVYGGVGVGKTHLLQAIAQATLLRRVGAHVSYCSSETFTNEMVEAIQKRQTVDFRAKYRSVDFLLVDDIQFIAGRESTQEEFFHTFNQLYGRGKQLVFSCDRNPAQLPNLQERLKSRFVGGLVIAIEPPELELREAILLAKAKELGLEIDFSIVRSLAENLGPSVRDLEGGLLRLLAASRLTGKKVDLSLVKTVVGVRHPQDKKPVPKILEEISAFFSLPVSEIKSPRRAKACVFPRQVAMYLLRKEAHLSFNEIAQEFGGRDHTTAIYSVNKVENLVEKGGEVARLVGELHSKVFGV